MNGHVLTTILLAAAAWAGLLGLSYLARWLHHRRPEPAAATEPPISPAVEVAEFVSEQPAFDSAYAVSPAAIEDSPGGGQ